MGLIEDTLKDQVKILIDEHPWIKDMLWSSEDQAIRDMLELKLATVEQLDNLLGLIEKYDELTKVDVQQLKDLTPTDKKQQARIRIFLKLARGSGRFAYRDGLRDILNFQKLE